MLTVSDRKLLWSRAGNVCSFPTCKQALTHDLVDARSGEIVPDVIGEEAHIRSPKPGGPRYDVEYPKHKLETYENRILMCPTHHAVIDAKGGAAHTAEQLESMKVDHEMKRRARKRLDRAVDAYVADRYKADDKVLFRQAGLEPRVDDLFVDVPVACSDGAAAGPLLRRIAAAAPGDVTQAAESTIVGGVQALLHPGWSGHALLVGGPGQGKTTLLQYLCQFHRARLNKDDHYVPEHRGIDPITETIRVPIRVELRRFASWLADRPRGAGRRRQSRRAHSKNKDNLETYLLEHLNDHCGVDELKPRDLALLLETRPILLALDGLDEVADIELRNRVSREVTLATTRLYQSATDLVVLVTSRPGSGLAGICADHEFSELRLQKLTEGLRLQFFHRWADVRELSEDEAGRLLASYTQSQTQSHIRDLAAYPMQLAIVLHLLQNRGHLPQQRTALYRDYLQTFLDREQHEEKEPLVSQERTVLEDVHAFLGWHLQKEAEHSSADGRLPKSQLEPLLEQHLDGRADDLSLAHKFFTAFESRVLCLLERPTGFFQFEVPSLREYFASVYLDENTGAIGQLNTRDDCIKELVARPYWLNVFRFLAGHLTKLDVRALPSAMAEVQAEGSLGQDLHVRRAALRILDDRVFQGHLSRVKQSTVDLALADNGMFLAEMGLLDDTGGPLRLDHDAGGAEVANHVRDRVASLTSVPELDLAADLLLAHTHKIEDLRDWWVSAKPPSAQTWIHLGCRLGLLTDPRGSTASRLRELLAGSTDGSTWLAEPFCRHGYRGSSDTLLARCRSEINDGAGEVIECRPPGALGDLVSRAQDCVGRSSTGTPGPQPSGGGRRRRRTSPGTFTQSPIAFPSDKATDRELATFLEQVSETWGDGWLLRRSVCTVDATRDISTLSSLVDDLADVPLQKLVQTQAEAWTHPRDVEWWRAQLPGQTETLGLRIWILMLLTIPYVEVVKSLAYELDNAVNNLSVLHFRALEIALTDLKRKPRVRGLLVDEEIRRGSIEVSTRTLWLLRLAAPAGSTQHLDTRIASAPKHAAVVGLGPLRLVIDGTRPGLRKLPHTALHGTRAHVPQGTLPADRLKALTARQVREIVLAPTDWPSDVVEIAFHHAMSQLPTMESMSRVSEDWDLDAD